MSKQAAFFVPYWWSPHIETDLEIMHAHIAAGDEVTIFICSGELPTCYSNVEHDEEICRKCTVIRRNGLNLVGLTDKVKIKNFVNIEAKDIATLQAFQNRRISNLSELLALQLDDCYPGRIIYNELICTRNESEPCIAELTDFIAKALESYVLIYLSFRNHFASFVPDIFYTFNGRLIVADSAVGAAKASGIPFALHDRAGQMNRYWIVQNNSMHSPHYWNEQMESTWRDSKDSLEKRMAIGSRWFEERVQNQRQAWFSFTEDQNVDLPENFDATKTNIVIFNTSEHEFSGMEEYKLPFYETQNAGLMQIAKDLQDSDVQIYLRVHPHLKDKQNTQNRFIATELTNKFKNFKVISAADPIRTYSLMKHADAVVTFGSTMGVEAAFQGIPSLLLGHSWYDELGACTIPTSHDHLIELIRSGGFKISDEEKEQRKIAALKYAYFHEVSGLAYSLFKQTDVFDIRYNGVILNDQPPSYGNGLQQEIRQRTDLDRLNPLTAAVMELTDTADILAEKNQQLQTTVDQLTQQIELLSAQTQQPAGLNRLHRLKRSVKQKLQRLLN